MADPVKLEATVADPAVKEIMSMLIDWHDRNVAQLKEMQDCKELRIDAGDDGKGMVITDPRMLSGVRIGIHIALELLGEFPVTIS